MPLDHFGWIAPYYESVFRPRFNEDWLRLLNLPGNGRMLDIGGGTGRIGQFFADHMEVVLLDESHPMLRQSKTKNNLQPIQGSAENLPFADEAFSRVIMIDALHHLADQTEAIKEMVRVLAPGGRLMIEEPDIRWVGIKFIALIEKILGMRSYFLTGNKIIELFQNTGLTSHLESSKGVVWIIGDKV